MRHAVLSLAAALTAALALSAPAASQAGDRWGDGWGGDGAYTEVHRDGNVFYNAYNSQDGYARGGYWARPGDDDGYGCGECAYGGDGDGYGYGGEGYGNERGYAYGYGGEGYGRDPRHVYYANYGHVDLTRRAIHREEHRRRCEQNGGREYNGHCY